MTTEVMSGIWSNRVDYSSPVSKAHWMDSGYLLPTIAYKTKSDNLSSMTIVVHIQKVLMVVVALQRMCIVMTNQNALYPLIQ
jgi:hypothetical protein